MKKFQQVSQLDKLKPIKGLLVTSFTCFLFEPNTLDFAIGEGGIS